MRALLPELPVLDCWFAGEAVAEQVGSEETSGLSCSGKSQRRICSCLPKDL